MSDGNWYAPEPRREDGASGRLAPDSGMGGAAGRDPLAVEAKILLVVVVVVILVVIGVLLLA